jgi:LPS sulfotransferase NodH
VEAERIAQKNRRLRKLRQQLAAKNRELERLRAQLGENGSESRKFKPENIIWIFCTGRTGSTWLGSMMGDIEGHAMWKEPLVGRLFGEFYYERAAHKRGRAGILGLAYKETWMRSVRSIVLDGAAVRYPELVGDGYVTIKEPHGSIGAPLLMEAIPESRLVFLVRDPRDVVSSALDGQKQDSWTSKAPKWRETTKPQTLADTDPERFVWARANTYLRDISKAKEAYDAHQGYRVLVRYEELRADTLGTMKRIYSKLDVPVDEGELARVVEKHSWENVPEEEKGEGKFYRKATPGGWREDLTEEQARVVEEITAPLLEEYYGRTP